MKMKSQLCNSGITKLYSHLPSPNVKVQVMYSTRVNSTILLRVADPCCISPIIMLIKLIDVYVGDIILVKKVQLQSAGTVKDQDCIPFMDFEVNYLQILDCQVIESHSNVAVIYPTSSNQNSSIYWNSLTNLRNYLVKGDGNGESYFNETETRRKLLQPDCNLLRERGNELYKRQQFVKAILHYDMAKQKDHYDARVWNNCSLAYLLNKDYEKAKLDALVALKLDPFCKKGYYRAGQAFNSCGDSKTAIEILEAGLYLCGKCENIEGVLQTIKDTITASENKFTDESTLSISKNITSNTTTITNSSSGNNNNKKKNNHVDNSNKSNSDKNNSRSNVNLAAAKKASKIKESIPKKPTNKEIEKPSKIESPKSGNGGIPLERHTDVGMLASLIEGAKVLYEKRQYSNALHLLESVMRQTEPNLLDKKETEVLKYLIAVCQMNSSGDFLEASRTTLLSISNKDLFPYPAAVHYWLATVYELIDNSEKVLHHANACGMILKKNNTKYNLVWPMTQDLIKETRPDQLKKWFKEGAWRTSNPISKCRHSDCVSVQGHCLANQEIYSCDMDFRGYIEVECEEYCSIVYHPCCWKSIKDMKENGQTTKKCDKDFLDLQCFTPDCSGKIYSVRTFDEDCKLKTETAKDRKEKKSTITAKQKKKKDKKKTSYQKYDDKKKKQSELDEVKLEDEVEIVTEETALPPRSSSNGKTSAAFAADPINYDGANFKILKPDDEDFNEFSSQKSKTKLKKKKKAKQVAQITIIPDEVEDRCINNEYLARLKALKVQRDSMEVESSAATQPSNEWSRSSKFLPDCVLDPDNPFYLPQHLQDNPEQLENFLRSKFVTASSSDIQPETINSLLEFMHDLMKVQKPMNVNDSRIRDYITEYFPPNAVAYVNKCGGVKSFLLQSFKFALIDDFVCVKEQVLTAQDMAVQTIVDKFKSTKFLISDGHKAAKYSHLLDDSKSTCSTNSSQSNNFFAAASSSDSNSNLNKIDHASSATPYKSAATMTLSNVLSTSTKEPEKDLISQLIKPKPIPPSSSKKKENSKKSKLKTMDIDDFEEQEIGKLFNASKASNNEKRFSVTSESSSMADVFHSDEDLTSNKKDSSNSELKEAIKKLQKEVDIKSRELAKISEEKELLAVQNEDLNDRLSQSKTKSSVEINALKKKMEDSHEITKFAESNVETMKAEMMKKDHELRKIMGEKNRLLEETKSFAQKKDALSLTIDQLRHEKNLCEQEIKQKSIHLAEQQQDMMKFQESANKLNEIAREAETKYMVTKKELLIMHLDKTFKRLNYEINVLRELLSESTESTQPSKSQVVSFINDYEESALKISNNIKSIQEDGSRYIELLNAGRHLNSLPPGDIQIPTMRDLTLAPLLAFRNPLLKTNKTPPMHGSTFHRDPNNMAPGGRPFSFNQMGPSIGSTLRASSNEGRGGVMDPIGSKSQLGMNAFGNIVEPSVLRSKLPETSCSSFLNGAAAPFESSFGSMAQSVSSTDSSPISSLAFSASGQVPQEMPNSYSKPGFEKNHLFAGNLPWNFNEENLKPMTFGNHPLNVHAASKEIKRPVSKMNVPSSMGKQMVPPPQSSSHHLLQTKPPSAFGLQSLVNASKNARTMATPTTPTQPQQQQQPMRVPSNPTVGTIGHKVVRPTPRPVTQSQSMLGLGGLSSMANAANAVKEENFTNSTSYKRLMDECKKKFGNEFPESNIHLAIRSVRERNNNSLSGLARENILSLIENQLRAQKIIKPSVAPWADIIHLEEPMIDNHQWRGLRNIDEEECTICFEKLITDANTTPLECGHVFHTKCIEKWLNTKSDCPICRKFALSKGDFPTLPSN